MITLSELDLSIIAQIGGVAVTEVNPTLARLLVTDSLTGLFNRAYFQERLRRELKSTNLQRPLALLVVDLNRFKEVNDQYGHKAGDLALQMVARGLSSRRLPLGLQLIGKSFEEALLLQVGHAYEEMTTWHRETPD
jgi:PleD family two-component response regulator